MWAARSPTSWPFASGEIRTVKVPTVDARTPSAACSKGRARRRRQRVAGVQPRQHPRTQRDHHAPAAEDRFPDHAGHRDILDMGRTWRPLDALTDPHWRRSFGDAARPLVPRYLRRGIQERITADGGVLIPLSTPTQARSSCRCCKRCDVQGVAICLINAYVNHAHERAAARAWSVEDARPESPARSRARSRRWPRSSPARPRRVVDVLMKLIYGRLYRRGSRTGCDDARVQRPAQFRRLRREARPVGRRDACSRSRSCSPGRRRAPSRARTSAR